MICQKCEEAGEKSTLEKIGKRKQGSERTSQFFDEDGHEHFHDPNVRQQAWKCSQDHFFLVMEKIGCNQKKCSVKAKRAVKFFLPEELEDHS